MEPVKNILVCRTDNLKSLVLTAPLFQAIRKTFPKARLVAMVSPVTAPVLENNPYIDEVIIDDKNHSHRGASGFMRLSKELEEYKFDTALMPHSNWRLLSLAMSAGIKRRVANGFRPYLPLINKPIWLHKSHPPIHETSYALAFVERITHSNGNISAPKIYISEKEKEQADKWILRRTGYSSNEVICIHPVCNTPAFSLSLDMWHKFATYAMKKTQSKAILITGTAHEKHIAERITGSSNTSFVNVSGELSLRELCAVQSQLPLMIGPNCGPLHTAAASGAPVIGLFPPLMTMAKEKWQPLNKKVAIIQPNLDKPCIKCLTTKCQLYPCLDTISIEDLDKAIESLNLQ